MEKKIYLERDNVKIPAILEMPNECKAFVLLCHGTGSEKNEVGNMFQTLAMKLSENNIGSIRIDFADCGERMEYNEKVSFLGQVYDIETAYEYVSKMINKKKIGILGFSQGARIMAEFIHLVKDLKFAISWSGSCLDYIGHFQTWFDDLYEDAKKNGSTYLELGFRKPLCYSIDWFEEIKNTTPLTSLSEFNGPILAISGTKDELIPYTHANEIINVSNHKFSKAIIIDDADHIYNVLSDDSKADLVIKHTLNWIESIL